MPYKDQEAKRIRRRAWHEAHREEQLLYMHAYYKKCTEEIPGYAHARYEARREQCLAYARAYRKAHREEKQNYSRIWAKAHPQLTAERKRRRRALERGATIGPIDLHAIKRRDRMQCAICGKKVADKDFTLDHTIPLSLGGAHTQENLRVAHRRCNSRRHTGCLPVQMVLL